MRVLVTGASGLLGINYCLHFEDKQNITGIFHLQELFSDRIFYKHVDLSVEKNVKKLIEDQKISKVHCMDIEGSRIKVGLRSLDFYFLKILEFFCLDAKDI